jgi:hypothetical protein
VILFFALCWLSCGQSPSEAPPVLTGLLKISATVDSVAVDSMIVVLDDLPIGIHANPFVLPGVLSGVHQVNIIKTDPTDAIYFSTIPQLVFVPPYDTARVKFLLTKLAPDFEKLTLGGEKVRLKNFLGQVVLLVFFSHT